MKLKYTPLQIIIEILSLTGIVLMAVYLYIQWGNIPERFPTHFDMVTNKYCNYRSRNYLLILPIANVVTYILISFFTFFPSYWILPTKAVQKNSELTYKIAKNALIITKLVTVAVFNHLLFFEIDKIFTLETAIF